MKCLLSPTPQNLHAAYLEESQGGLWTKGVKGDIFPDLSSVCWAALHASTLLTAIGLLQHLFIIFIFFLEKADF